MDGAETDAVEGQCFGLCGRLRGGGCGDAVDQLIAERAEVASTGAGGVVAAPAALGRGWKYLGAEKFWPIRAEPTAWVSSGGQEPSFASREPLACTRKNSWPIPQMTRG